MLRTSALVSVVEVVVCVVLAMALCFSNAGLLGWVGALFFAGMAFRMGRLGARKLQQIARLEDVAPLTQANAALLPPTQTLVRASALPQAEAGVLLRAARDTQDAPAQQLLRATDSTVNAPDSAALATMPQIAQALEQPQEAALPRSTSTMAVVPQEEQTLRTEVSHEEDK